MIEDDLEPRSPSVEPPANSDAVCEEAKKLQEKSEELRLRVRKINANILRNVADLDDRHE